MVESGSIAEGARRLNLTPAAVSQRIRALETELGITLLARSGRTVRSTDAGQAILERAQQLVQNTRELRVIATADTAVGAIRIGAASSATKGILPNVLPTLAKTYPRLDIYVVEGTSVDLYQRVLNGELDVAIVVQPPFGLLKACDWELLREEPLIVIAPADMPITTPQKLLKSKPFIRYDRNHWGGRLADGYLQQEKIRPIERLELDALDAIAVMVARGFGVSLVPDWAPPWPEGLKLNKLPVEAPTFVRRLGILWMRNSINIRLVRAFVAQTRASVFRSRK